MQRYDSFVICQSAGYFFGRCHWFRNCFIIHTQKISPIQLNEKIQGTIFATTNTVYFKQEFLSIVNMTLKLGPANGIPLALTFWLMCFKSHISHLVKHHSYGRLASVRQNFNADSVFRLWSDFYDLISFHISHLIFLYNLSWLTQTKIRGTELCVSMRHIKGFSHSELIILTLDWNGSIFIDISEPKAKFMKC